MQYKVISKVVNNKRLVGYMLQPSNISSDELKTFYPIETILRQMIQGTLELKDVKITKEGKLRGCNGFLLSRVPEENLKDLEEVNANLLAVLRYIMQQMCSSPNIMTRYGAEVKGIVATYFVDTKIEEYLLMEHSEALKDLRSTLKFYKENLPKELEESVDEIQCDVDSSGNVRIMVAKKLM